MALCVYLRMAYVRCVNCEDMIIFAVLRSKEEKKNQNPLQNAIEYYPVISLNWFIFILLQFLLYVQRRFFEH